MPFLNLILCFFIFSILSCGPAFQKISTKPVIQVNEHKMTVKEFSVLVARKLKDLDSLSAKDPVFIERIKQQVLKDFVVRCLTIDYAHSQKISVEDKKLDQEVNRIRSGYPDDLSFRRELALENQSFSEWREELRYLQTEKLVFAKINEKTKDIPIDEVRKYYEQRKDFFKRKERIYFRQIVIDDEARADFIKTELKKRKFEDLAKRYSITPESKVGGVVGWIEKGTVDYFDSLFGKPLNQVLGPTKSPFGFHLIRIEKKEAASAAPFEEIKPLLENELRAKNEQAAFVAWLDSQLRASRVLKDIELINAVKIETRSEN